MKAVVLEETGAPEVLQIKDLPIPQVGDGWVLMRVRAFGLNRSEVYTRQRNFISLEFPIIPGTEAVGEVVEDPSGTYNAGQKVATAMGPLGSTHSGSYEEYTLVPVENLMPLETTLSWETLGAIPEMYLTAWGSLYESMEVEAGQTLLVRGGTSSVGMMTIAIAKAAGLTVLATTRQESKRDALIKQGADYVIIDDGEIADKVREIYPNGVDCVYELVGTTTLLDSMAATAKQGIVCFAGLLGGEWVFKEFNPLFHIPTSVKLTSYSVSTIDYKEAGATLQKFVESVEAGEISVPVDRVFKFDDIVEAHRYMEDSHATGKIVVVTE